MVAQNCHYVLYNLHFCFTMIDMTFWLALSIILGGLVILFGEILHHKKYISGEASRKLIHISHALVVASWPFFVGYWFIVLAELLFVAVVLLARHLGIMPHLRDVKRLSWGEFFFALSIVIIAFIEPSPWIFLAAMLHLGLADGLAALVGRKFPYGRYVVLSHNKTFTGSLTFAFVSVIIIAAALKFGTIDIAEGVDTYRLLLIPLVTTLAENTSPYGSDNLTVPLLVTALLGLFSA